MIDKPNITPTSPLALRGILHEKTAMWVVNTYFFADHFFFFLWPLCWIKQWYREESLHSGQSLS